MNRSVWLCSMPIGVWLVWGVALAWAGAPSDTAGVSAFNSLGAPVHGREGAHVTWTTQKISSRLVSAAGSSAHPLTVQEAQTEARRNGPDAAVWRAEVAGAQHVEDDASRRFHHDPGVALVSRPPRFLQNQNEHLWDISVSIPVGPLSATRPRRAMADHQTDQKSLETADRLAMLDEAVARAVADLAYAQRAFERAHRLARLATNLVWGSVVTEPVSPEALLEADADRQAQWSAKARLVDARADLDRARLRLARLLGRASADGLAVDDSFSPPELPPRPDFVRLVEQSPRVLAQKAACEAARAALRYQDRLTRPTPVLGVSYGRGPWGFLTDELGIPSDASGTSKPQVAFTLMLNVPLFERNRAARVQAAAGLAVAEARLEVARADVRADLEARWVELVRAKQGLEALKQVPEVSRRDFEAVLQLSRQGQMGAAERARWLRNLETMAQTFEDAVRQWRYAVAAWQRVAGIHPQSLDIESGGG